MAPAALNGFYNVLLRQNPNFREYTITVTNDPLPRDLQTEVSGRGIVHVHVYCIQYPIIFIYYFHTCTMYIVVSDTNIYMYMHCTASIHLYTVEPL